MIIIGYQGIGKSTLVNAHHGSGFIDLESNNFFIDGKREEDWYIPYCNIALSLSEQGYHVFTSSHEVVRRCLKRINYTMQPIIVCYPVIYLRELWTEKLKNRYEHTKSEKDFKAWKNAEDRYVENITQLKSESDFYLCPITDINYDLFDLICETMQDIEREQKYDD